MRTWKFVFLYIYIRVTVVSSSLPIQVGERCVWQTEGVNVTDAGVICRAKVGRVLSITDVKELTEILTSLAVDLDPGGYIYVQGKCSASDHRNSSNIATADGADADNVDWVPLLLKQDNLATVEYNVACNNEIEYLTDTATILCEIDDLTECTSKDAVSNNLAHVAEDESEEADDIVKAPSTDAEHSATLQTLTSSISEQTTIAKVTATNPSLNAAGEAGVSETTANTTVDSILKQTGAPTASEINSDDATNDPNVNLPHATESPEATGSTIEPSLNLPNATDTSTPPSNDSFTDIVIPDGDNATRVVDFETLVQEIIQKANRSDMLKLDIETTTAAEDLKNKTSQGSLVKEVNFFAVNGQVQAAMNPFLARRLPGLSIDDHLNTSRQLQNVSSTLKDLCGGQVVDNTTMMKFTETISNVVLGDDIAKEPSDIKGDLFKDVLSVAEYLIDNNVETEDVVLTTEAVDFTSRHISSSNYGEDTKKIDVDFGRERTDMMASLSPHLFDHLNSDEIRLSTVSYRKLDSLAKSVDPRISSSVMSVTVHSVKGNKTHKEKISTPNAITFQMETFIEQNRKESQRQCSYWDLKNSVWSSKECVVTGQNYTHTMCKCDHLTNFAILVMHMEPQDISIQSEQALFTLTTVGCSLSIASLFMTLFTYVYLQMLGREKIMIHFNLSLALLLGQVVFVSSSDAYKNPSACKAVAILLHFLFMAAFSWMMVEGLALYFCCTKGVFNRRDMRVRYFLLGWGVPVVVVAISLAARFPDYGNGPQYSCWLSVNNGLIWAFMGPMLVIVLLNMLVMGLVVRVFLTLKANSEKTEVARLKGSLRAMMTLLPLLGLSWVLSLLVPYSVVFQYFFVIANTIQGMCIFFLHCICNEEIRKRFQEKRRRWSNTRSGSDPDMTYHGRRKVESFDAVVVKPPVALTQLTTAPEYGEADGSTASATDA